MLKIFKKNDKRSRKKPINGKSSSNKKPKVLRESDLKNSIDVRFKNTKSKAKKVGNLFKGFKKGKSKEKPIVLDGDKLIKDLSKYFADNKQANKNEKKTDKFIFDAETFEKHCKKEENFLPRLVAYGIVGQGKYLSGMYKCFKFNDSKRKTYNRKQVTRDEVREALKLEPFTKDKKKSVTIEEARDLLKDYAYVDPGKEKQKEQKKEKKEQKQHSEQPKVEENLDPSKTEISLLESKIDTKEDSQLNSNSSSKSPKNVDTEKGRLNIEKTEKKRKKKDVEDSQDTKDIAKTKDTAKKKSVIKAEGYKPSEFYRFLTSQKNTNFVWSAYKSDENNGTSKIITSSTDKNKSKNPSDFDYYILSFNGTSEEDSSSVDENKKKEPDGEIKIYNKASKLKGNGKEYKPGDIDVLTPTFLTFCKTFEVLLKYGIKKVRLADLQGAYLGNALAALEKVNNSNPGREITTTGDTPTIGSLSDLAKKAYEENTSIDSNKNSLDVTKSESLVKTNPDTTTRGRARSFCKSNDKHTSSRTLLNSSVTNRPNTRSSRSSSVHVSRVKDSSEPKLQRLTSMSSFFQYDSKDKPSLKKGSIQSDKQPNDKSTTTGENLRGKI